MGAVMKVLGTIIVVLLFFACIGYGFQWIQVYRAETVGKALQNSERVVYEETNSFSKGKRQEIIKAYKEWQEAESIEDKKAIENVLAMSLADFDEDKFITDPKLLSWVKEIKY